MSDSNYFFVFDVESVGLYGEGFAVAGGVYLDNGACQYEFSFSCPPEEVAHPNPESDPELNWVKKNIPVLEVTHHNAEGVRDAFWKEWEKARMRYRNIVMVAEVPYPVEMNFIRACLGDNWADRGELAPYPFVDIASIRLAAGFDPIATSERKPSELPAHNPLADSRQSARLLAEALDKIRGRADKHTVTIGNPKAVAKVQFFSGKPNDEWPGNVPQEDTPKPNAQVTHYSEPCIGGLAHLHVLE
jgi:hypothetical protein